MLGGVVVNILREHKLRGMLEDVHCTLCGGGGLVWLGNWKRGGGEEVNVKAKHNDSHQMGMTRDIEEERIA